MTIPATVRVGDCVDVVMRFERRQLSSEGDGDTAVLVAVDISGASSRTITFAPPSGDSFTRTASLVGDGTDGRAHYVCTAADLVQAGSWRAQGKVTIGGRSYTAQAVAFEVEATL